jgi:hypothetical protein
VPPTSSSQAAQAAALLTKASESLLDAYTALSDILELAKNPDGEVDSQQETLALVGMTTVARRHLVWVTDEIDRVERAMLEQNDYASEADDAR